MWHKLPVFLVLLVSLSAVYSSIAYYAVSKAPAQPFMEFGIFSDHGLQGYISNNNLTIKPPQTTTWTIAIGNMMGSAQYSTVIVRLGNSTTQVPNSTTPATILPELTSMQLFQGIGETSQLTFTWTAESANQANGLTYLNLTINGQPLGQSQVGVSSGQHFRFIFELWTYDTNTKSFQYGYTMSSATIGEWLQVWFNS